MKAIENSKCAGYCFNRTLIRTQELMSANPPPSWVLSFCNESRFAHLHTFLFSSVQALHCIWVRNVATSKSAGSCWMRTLMSPPQTGIFVHRMRVCCRHARLTVCTRHDGTILQVAMKAWIDPCGRYHPPNEAAKNDFIAFLRSISAPEWDGSCTTNIRHFLQRLVSGLPPVNWILVFPRCSVISSLH